MTRKIDTITITISGKQKSGKSGLAFAIAHVLKHLYGLCVTIKDDNGTGIVDEPEALMKRTYTNRMNKLAERGTWITIKTNHDTKNQPC